MASVKSFIRLFGHPCLACRNPGAAGIFSGACRRGLNVATQYYVWGAGSTLLRTGQSHNWVPYNLHKMRSYGRDSGRVPGHAPSSSKCDEEDNDAFLFGRYDPDEEIDENDSDFFIPDLSSTEDDDKEDP
ncbi:hypothetical protein KP509_14G022500 [Ceratopteris richardii]|uniref:Uncharacterized protein n=1 Tax=Ceratopteris richardii TaxID=49495 RepID=A0A8T2TB88_CERRI|nr:hypothetical protein KP509_14G022500 [Ceratopteris richardii]KAH7414993.1 hypothetical protein KP509_14G022500 [Ceratopteris richardii]